MLFHLNGRVLTTLSISVLTAQVSIEASEFKPASLGASPWTAGAPTSLRSWPSEEIGERKSTSRTMISMRRAWLRDIALRQPNTTDLSSEVKLTRTQFVKKIHHTLMAENKSSWERHVHTSKLWPTTASMDHILLTLSRGKNLTLTKQWTWDSEPWRVDGPS